MKDLLARLLDLKNLSLSDEGVRFGFERSAPPYAWAAIVFVIVVFAAWSYRRLVGPLWARSALASVRALTLLLVAALLAGPRLVKQSESIEKDWVMVLVDRSASMGIADAPTPAGGRETREQQLRSALAASWPMWRDLSRDRTVVWLGFDAGAYDLAQSPSPEGGLALADPLGKRTSLAGAVEQALRRAAARPLSSIVVLTDGRSVDEPARATLRQLQAERVPIHVVPLGSPDPIGDLAIRRADGPGVAFVNDTTPITVELERAGGGAGTASGTVRITDAATGLTVAERRVEVGAETSNVTLTATPTDAGKASWKVDLIPDQPDLIEGNNHAEVALELVDRPMRVLYIDGYPRWEQRYLKNLLLREKSVQSANLLLAPDRKYLQEGDIEVTALPDSPERWADFDAIILGDVDPGVFTPQQLQGLREHIAARGAGLLWIAGPGSTPNLWFKTPLADLLPMSGAAGAVQPGAEPVIAEPTPIAERLGVLRLGSTADEGWPAEMRSPETGWNLLRGAPRIGPESLKPAVEILASARAANAPASATAWPMVMSMRFGSGRVLYVATDETWRWRYGRGEALPERFWVQMLRLLARESLSRAGRAATLTIAPRRATVDQPVRVEIELIDQSLIDQNYRGIAVRLERKPEPGEEGSATAAELTLRPEQSAAPVGGAPGPARRFAAVWLPPESGAWAARVTEPGLGSLVPPADALVTLADDELRRPETDHPLLARLAADTGGRVVPPADLGGLAADLPNRRLRLLRETAEPVWDTPVALIALISLLTLEWAGRKVLRLI